MTREPQISTTHVGDERQPVVVIDGFFPDPEVLREAAISASYEPGRNLYPGIRGPLPGCYWSASQVRLCQTAIARAFNLSGKLSLIDASFSIVTTPPEDLSVAQRLPHPDAFDPRHVALVHYLVPESTEGTAFYRHRSTGLQTIGERDRDSYFRRVGEELRRHGPPATAYIDGDTALFEKIHEVGGHFNRAVLYRGQQLHSGAIRPGTQLSADPKLARLTVTAFMTID